MITLFGATGSGKSEQGRLLSERYGWKWLDVRSILLGLNDEDITRALRIGISVDDEKAARIVKDILDRAKDEVGARKRTFIDTYGSVFQPVNNYSTRKQVVLDGFPFDYNQIKWMIDNDQIKDLEGVIVLQVPRGQIWQRLVQRKRVDDTRAAIERREDYYDQVATGMIRTLNMNGVKIGYINGVGEPEDVFARIQEQLGDWGMVPKKEFERVSISSSNSKAQQVERRIASRSDNLGF